MDGKEITFPVKIDEDLKSCAKTNNIHVTKFETISDLNSLKIIASEKRMEKMSKHICNTAESNI